MPLLRSAALIAVAVFTLGCSSKSDLTAPASTDTFGGSASATSVDVTMPSVVYTPNRIDIAKGGTVRFIFAALAHDVRFNGNTSAPADILVSSNTTISRTFANAGTFAFLCTLHANMSGTVTVH
jgi:plastocyanin